MEYGSARSATNKNRRSGLTASGIAFPVTEMSWILFNSPLAGDMRKTDIWFAPCCDTYAYIPLSGISFSLSAQILSAIDVHERRRETDPTRSGAERGEKAAPEPVLGALAAYAASASASREK